MFRTFFKGAVDAENPKEEGVACTMMKKVWGLLIRWVYFDKL
jgi:hypothetical protein